MVRMRICKQPIATCTLCNCERSEALELFEVYLTKGATIVVCDDCMVQLRDKAMRACCMVSERTKTSHDMAIIRKRLGGTYIPEKRGKAHGKD